MFVISIVYIDSDKRGSRPLKTQLMRLLRAKSTLGCSQELIMSQISFANIFVANILKKIFVFKNFICKRIGISNLPLSCIFGQISYEYHIFTGGVRLS